MDQVSSACSTERYSYCKWTVEVRERGKNVALFPVILLFFFCILQKLEAGRPGNEARLDVRAGQDPNLAYKLLTVN